MSSRNSVRDFRARTSRQAVGLANIARRVLLGATEAIGIWQLLGFEVEGQQETFPDTEVFGIPGFSARPRDGDEVEAIVINIDMGDGHPVVVGARCRKIELELEKGEVAVYNHTGSRLIIKANGEVHVTDASGVANKVAMKSDVDAVATWNKAHVHSALNAVATTAAAHPVAVGSSKFKTG